jgi:hypothetical protein
VSSPSPYLHFQVQDLYQYRLVRQLNVNVNVRGVDVDKVFEVGGGHQSIRMDRHYYRAHVLRIEYENGSSVYLLALYPLML